ncbi:hypothetical protein PLICRDRAFT_165465 [Plicaturopsis crispa FD-325 SS-3]|nr:hypothetical protein PLICRDRAFT_165465 [Plicaturopsis crispa FD-325 SS-3]
MSSVEHPQLPFRPGHPPRRDNQSISSSHSAAGSSRGSERGSSRTAPHPAVESAVTRLLVAIKQLLEALSLWSSLQMSEAQVSDVYVRLGNDFNAAVAAFAAFNIDMTELMGVPDDLRNVLEQCLAEDATPDNLEIYLPTVRQIITNLLQGLRGKQSIYRRIVSDHRHKSSEQSGQDRTDSRSSRSSRKEGPGHRSQLSRAIAENERPTEREGTSRRAAQSSTRRKESSSSAAPSSVNGDEPFVGGFAPAAREQVTETNGHSDRSQRPSQSSRQQPPRYPSPRPRTPQGSQGSPRQATSSPSTPKEPPLPQSPPAPAAPQPQVPSSVKRYSLVDKPSAPSVTVDVASDQENGPDRSREFSSTPPPDTPPIDAVQLQAPAMANSLAALQKSDALERRASKRFSTYNISKMTGSSSRERSTRNHPNRRSLLAGGTTPTPGELAVLTEVDDDEEASESRGSREARRGPPPRTDTPLIEEEEAPPVPPIPPHARTPSPAVAQLEKSPRPPQSQPPQDVSGASDTRQPPAEGSQTSFPVFLQLGREVKKAMLEPGLSFSYLRMIFVDKFSYNPGLENFPAIYIRDPSSGVQYELEDMSEVKEKCLLSLNIEPLDQIKQHIDSQISNLSHDIKELKTAVNSSNRQPSLPAIIGHPLSESTPAPRPTDRHFQQVARRLSRLVSTDDRSNQTIQPQMTGQSLQPQMTGGSILSEYSTRVVTDLKTQFDEVQNLRRDLGIMRQLYTEFMKQTKESLGTLRTQTQSVKKLATDNVGGARGYIDSGKTKLDTRSQNVLTKVEELQDTVESVKDDVLKRHMTPKPFVLKNIKSDVDKVAAELESLKEHIKTIKPMWKKTWEEELQNIVEEQQFLHHQEEFLSDLLEDHKAVVEVYGHVEKVISIRGTGPNRTPKPLRGYKPPPPEEGHDGLSTVMLEIRGAQVDPDKRMKAIAASQKSREKELATRSDEFQAELSGFVGGKKLKMTGGAEEAERVRQKRNEQTLKAMFSPGGSTMPMEAMPDSFEHAEMSPQSSNSG